MIVNKELLEKMFDSDDDVQINVKPKVKAKAKPEVKAKAKRVPPPPTQPIPENMERVYDSEEEYYCLRPKPKDNTKDIIKPKPITKPEPQPKDNIFSRIKFRCE